LERDPEAVVADLRDGMVTPWAARNIYRVAYDDETLRLDREKTRELREEARARRKQRGKPYGEFEKEWLKLRPKDEVIKYYGTYPVSGAI
jgi:acetophenone carboxylase